MTPAERADATAKAYEALALLWREMRWARDHGLPEDDLLCRIDRAEDALTETLFLEDDAAEPRLQSVFTSHGAREMRCYAPGVALPEGSEQVLVGSLEEECWMGRLKEYARDLEAALADRTRPKLAHLVGVDFMKMQHWLDNYSPTPERTRGVGVPVR